MKALGSFAIAFAFMTVLSGSAEADSVMTRPMEQARSDLTTLLGCVWEGTDATAICVGAPLDYLGLTRAKDGTLDTVEIATVIETHPRDRKREEASGHALLRAGDYLLPEWDGRASWLAAALDDVRRHRSTKQQIEGLNVVMRWNSMRNVESAAENGYAEFIITKGRMPDDLDKFELRPVGKVFRSVTNLYRVRAPVGLSICAEEFGGVAIAIVPATPCRFLAGLEPNSISIGVGGHEPPLDLKTAAAHVCAYDRFEPLPLSDPVIPDSMEVTIPNVWLGGKFPIATCRKMNKNGTGELVAIAKRPERAWKSDYYQISALYEPEHRAEAERLFWEMIGSIELLK